MIRFVPSVSRQGVGWVGYELPRKSGRVLAELDNGKFGVKMNAVYINEAFVRFANPYPVVKSGDGGMYRNWIIAHTPVDKEEYLFFPASGRISGVIVKLFRDRGINPSNIHEYVFRIYRTGNTGMGIWNASIYYHDVDLPKFDPEKIGKGIIKQRETGFNVKVKIPFEVRSWDMWDDPIMDRAVEYLKDVIIPMQAHKPIRDQYIDWFKHYTSFPDDVIEQAYEFRNQVRLP